MRHTIVIVGRSEWLTTHIAELHTLVELFLTIGINNINPDFEPTYTIVADDPEPVIKNIIDNNLKTTILTGFYNFRLVPPNIPMQGFQYETLNKNFKWNINDNILPYCGFTHDLAIAYCIKKGFTDILLFGACDFTSQHYDNSDKFKYSQKLRDNSLYFIENICTKYSNIYTMNPESNLQVPHITMKEAYERYYGKR